MVTADQVALVEVGECVGTWQRNDWQGTLAPECLTAALRILSSSSVIMAEKAQCDQTG